VTPSEEQALAERVVDTMFARDALSRRLGMEIVSVAPRCVAVRMVVRADMLNGFGVCHGGVTFSLADSAMAFACNTHGNVTVAVDNSITYPKALYEGDVLTAVAEEESASNRLAYYRVTIRRGGDEVVSTFRGTVYRTSKPFFPDSE
jgi:acyl-CoA thioesterase